MIFDKRTKSTKDEWLTPPALLKALGPFDLDPCAPVKRPWATARHHFTVLDDGLSKKWFGRVWLNPPYGGFGPTWLRRLAEYGNGIGLVSARTDTRWFQECFRAADAVLFYLGRIRFHHIGGGAGAHSAAAPSAFLAYGNRNRRALKHSGLKGILIDNGARVATHE